MGHVALFACLLLLAACSGGGGGNAASPPSPPPPPASTSVSEMAFDRERTSDAARNEPREGSVTQSSRGTRDVSTTGVELNADFTGVNLPPGGTLDITRDSGAATSIPLENALDVLPLQDPGDGSDFQVLPDGYDFDPETGHRLDYIELEATDRRAFALFATDFVSRNSDTAFQVKIENGGENYLAFGIWAFSPSGADASAEVGAFADGVEFVTATRRLPITGTARYTGKTIGTYITTDDATGAMLGDVSLDVDFASGGSVTGEVNNIHIAEGYDIAGATLEADASVDLGRASIDAATGFFKGDTEYCTTAAACDGTPDGKWGGQFFGSGLDRREPRAAAGTWGVQHDEFTAIGAYGAWLYLPPPVPPPPSPVPPPVPSPPTPGPTPDT